MTINFVRLLHITAVLGAVLIGVTLWAWGQPLVSTSGELQLWVGSVFSSENSQQFADWYTLSHFIHGMLVVLLGRLFFPRASYAVLLAVAIATGVFWEIFEHTDFVLDQFRATTIYQGYLGDTVLNAVADYVWMMAGFFLACALSTRWIAAIIVVLEILAASIARDSLTLSTLTLIFPIDAIEQWQQDLKQSAPPPGG